MTEKRYTLRLHPKDNGVKIFNNPDEDNWRVLNLHFNDYEDAKFVREKLDPVVDLLNNLADENEQLKEIKERYDETIVEWNALKSEYDDLKNENEQLKEDKEFWKQQAEQYSNELEVLKHELLCKQLDKAPKEPVNCKCYYGDVE